MKKIVKVILFSGTLSFAAILLAGTAVAREKAHNESPMGNKPHMDKAMAATMSADMPHGMESGSHGHKEWVPPPSDYADKRNRNWNDNLAAARGMATFAQQCVQCHGLSGLGDGPLASSLSHKPANLSKHFHANDGISDGYLFWRVSEGGMVEPFKSANSTMPAFKKILNEQQRWDVLTYIHQQIHKGFSLKSDTDRHEESPKAGHAVMEKPHG